MRKYITEFIGTFFLCLTVILTVNGPAGPIAPLAIGSILMVMVFAGGHISGAHYNPAVTLAVWVRGKIFGWDVPAYLFSQLAGAILASLTGTVLLSAMGLPSPETHMTPEFAFFPGMLAEFLGTFALAWVMLNVATSDDTAGNSFYGLAIGFTILACAFAFGGISGGAFNPAVAISISLTGMTNWGNISAFLFGEVLGGITAAFAFSFVNRK